MSGRVDPGPIEPGEWALRFPLARTRRALYALLVATVTGVGVYLMLSVLGGNGLEPVEGLLLLLFAVTFLWIAQAFCSALLGALVVLLRLDPHTLRRRPAAPRENPQWSRTAVVMPVHNEDVARVLARLEATHADLAERGLARRFDFHLLSDTTDPAIARDEERALAELRARGGGWLSYRRRAGNAGRKAGNIAEFCHRSRDCDFMVVMDADSVMAAATLAALACAMERNPRAGIVQTVPIPVRQQTVFGRGVQFAASLYSPMLAAGQAFWQQDAGNYWGHNAIIRLAPFRAHCRLPVLSGRPPFGGEILSHDFVEAALMRRAGWQVIVRPDLGGSFEEVPGNLLDFAARDRRWSEGNLQHLRLVTARGLHPLSRLHFLLGAFAYGCSFLWLAMLLVGTVDALLRALSEPVYFARSHALFPDWPVTRSTEMWWLLAIVAVLLFLPKLLGVVAALADPARRRGFGGAPRLLLSATVETVLAVLIAPVLMCFHARFVASVILGRRASWEAPERDGRRVSWPEAWNKALLPTAGGVFWGAVTYAVTPTFFWSLLPVLVGLVSASALIVYTGHPRLGAWLERQGVFLCPTETAPDPVLERLAGRPVRPPRHEEASGARPLLRRAAVRSPG